MNNTERLFALLDACSHYDIQKYLGIDEVDTTVSNNLARCLLTADLYLQGSIGSDYPLDDPRAKELLLIVVAELYDNRGFTTGNGVSNNVRRIVDDLSLQLRLELRKKQG